MAFKFAIALCVTFLCATIINAKEEDVVVLNVNNFDSEV
jgi:hypothetical protein